MCKCNVCWCFNTNRLFIVNWIWSNGLRGLIVYNLFYFARFANLVSASKLAKLKPHKAILRQWNISCYKVNSKPKKIKKLKRKKYLRPMMTPPPIQNIIYKRGPIWTANSIVNYSRRSSSVPSGTAPFSQPQSQTLGSMVIENHQVLL